MHAETLQGREHLPIDRGDAHEAARELDLPPRLGHLADQNGDERQDQDDPEDLQKAGDG
jgi:hypothetical protein